MDNKFNVVCVWEGTVLGKTTVDQFEKWFLDNGFRIKYIDTVITKGSKAKKEQGGRSDVLFYIHDDDISKFAIWKLQYGIRWFDDAVNGCRYRYSKDVLDKYAK